MLGPHTMSMYSVAQCDCKGAHVTSRISSFSVMHTAIRVPIDTIAVYGEHMINSYHLSPARLTDADGGTFQTTISEEPLLYAASLKGSSLTNVKCYKTLNCYKIRRSMRNEKDRDKKVERA